MQQGGRVAPGEHAALEVGEVAVEEHVRSQQRHDALQVAVGEVGGVEADQREGDDPEARRGPALAPCTAHVGERRQPPAPAAGGADDDLEDHQQRDQPGGDEEASEGDAAGVPQRHARLGGRDERHETRRGCHEGTGEDAAGRQRPRAERHLDPWGPVHAGCCVAALRRRQATKIAHAAIRTRIQRERPPRRLPSGPWPSGHAGVAARLAFPGSSSSPLQPWSHTSLRP